MPSLKPHPVDQHVGARLRLRRKALKISQSALAASLGLTFQQVQKYERGANRISASMLHGMAKALGVRPEWFFETLPSTTAEDPAEPPGAAALNLLIACPEGMAMADVMARLPRRLQKRVLGLLAAMVGDTT